MKLTQEQRIIELELLVAEQDQTLRTMSDEVFAHQKKLDHLESTCNFLRDKFQTVMDESSPASPDNEKPPHY